MHINDERIKRLPPFLARIARATNFETAMKIGTAWGGTRRSFPARDVEKSALARLVGAEMAWMIVDQLRIGRRGEVIPYFDIPVVRDVERLTIKEQILAATGTTRQIALSLRCSERYVRMVRNTGTAQLPPSILTPV